MSASPNPTTTRPNRGTRQRPLRTMWPHRTPASHLARRLLRGSGGAGGERDYEPGRRTADAVEMAGRGEARRRADRVLERERRVLGLLDPLGVLGQPEADELRAELVQPPAAGQLLGDLAHGRDRDDVA